MWKKMDRREEWDGGRMERMDKGGKKKGGNERKKEEDIYSRKEGKFQLQSQPK